MEEALRESEERFRTVIENSRDGINMLDLETGRYIFMSPAQQKLTGFSPEELRDLPVEEAFERVHPDDREISISQQKAVAEGPDEGMTVEYRWKVKSGEYRWFSDSRKVVRDEKGRAIALVGVSRDITEGKQAEQALRESQQREQQRAAELEAVLQAVPASVWFADDPECLHITGNRAADELLRIDRGAESSLTAPIATQPRNFRMFREGRELSAEELPVQQAARGIAVNNSEFTFIFDDGTIRHMLGNAAPLWDEEGHTRGSVAAFVDITERKQMEETLSANEEKYRLLFQNMAEGFAVYELIYDERGEPVDWQVLEVNDAYTRHTGVAREQIVGRRISEFFPRAITEYLPVFATVVATQTPTSSRRMRKPSTVISASSLSRPEVAALPVPSRTSPIGGAHRRRCVLQKHCLPVCSTSLLTVSVSSEKMMAFSSTSTKHSPKCWGIHARRSWDIPGGELNLAPGTDEGDAITGLFREKKHLADHEFTFTTRENRVMTVLVSLVSITVNDEPCILAIGHDISKRKQSEEALRRAQAELAVGIQERAALEERQRLARELHDSVSQALYGVSLGINTALALFDSDQTKVLEALHYALSLTHGGLAEMRALIFELRPESLTQEGLVVALTKLVDASRVHHGIEVELGLCDEPDAAARGQRSVVSNRSGGAAQCGQARAPQPAGRAPDLCAGQPHARSVRQRRGL